MKTGAANSNTTLEFSKKTVSYNSENNLNNIHMAKKKKIPCAYHECLWRSGGIAALTYSQPQN
jgi:hypothetical protein